MILEVTELDNGLDQVDRLINKFNFIFRSNGKLLKDIKFDLKLDDIDPLTALILYKIFEYGKKHNCFYRSTVSFNKLGQLFGKYQLDKYIEALLEGELSDFKSSITPYENKGVFIAPHTINKATFKSIEELENNYTTIIEKYYLKDKPNITEYIRTSICEIASNYLNHAVNDDNSILMVQGNNYEVEVMCVDTSEGIASTLKKVRNGSRLKSFKDAFSRKVSSKFENGHCGTGLWLVNEVVKLLDGELKVYSEEFKYHYNDGKSNFIKNPHAFWRGTIIYFKLDIKQDRDIGAFFSKFVNEDNLGLKCS